MKRLILCVGTAMLALGFCGATEVHEWRAEVPARERVRMNPFPNNPATLESGAKIYAERCAKCHGFDATGRGKRPSLRTTRVQEATDGEILWLLRNGDLRYGMPSWSGLPEEQRWQVERYIKSLPAN